MLSIVPKRLVPQLFVAIDTGSVELGQVSVPVVVIVDVSLSNDKLGGPFLDKPVSARDCFSQIRDLITSLVTENDIRR